MTTYMLKLEHRNNEKITDIATIDRRTLRPCQKLKRRLSRDSRVNLEGFQDLDHSGRNGERAASSEYINLD